MLPAVKPSEVLFAYFIKRPCAVRRREKSLCYKRSSQVKFFLLTFSFKKREGGKGDERMKLQKPVRGVFFDLGWTLLYPVSGDWRFTLTAQKIFPPEYLRALPDDRWAKALQAAESYLGDHHLLRSMEEEFHQWRTYYGMLAEAVPELGLSPEDIRRVAEEQTYSVEDYGLLPGARETLETLSGKYRLGVISDTWPSIEPRLQKLGLREFFDCVTYSFTLGVFKPHPAMYRDALEKMGLPAAETVFIDDVAGNLRGAAEQGIQTVLICARPDADRDDAIPNIAGPGEIPGLVGA